MLTRIRNSVYLALAALRRAYLRRVWGMDIGKGVRISGKAQLDFTYPQGVHIGDYTIVTPGARIFTHDFVGAHHDHTRIGKCCFIGANAIITAGVNIGDHCVIAAGTVVNGHVPDGSMVAGNPPRIVKTGIITGRYGSMVDWAPDRNVPETQNSDGNAPEQPLSGAQQNPHLPEKTDSSTNG